MKNYALTIALLLCHYISVHAAIVNGFFQEKSLLEIEIRNRVELLSKDNTDKAIRQIEKKLKQLRKKYALVLKKYSKTEQLISAIEFIDPDLFARVSIVANAEGTLTNVYVRYVSCTSKEFIYFTKNYFTAKAYTSVRQSENNKNVCASLYGTNTITVTIGYGCNEIIALGHEFAHVLYVVPNLNMYSKFLYRTNNYCQGHSLSDPSYTFLEAVEDSFTTKYIEYLKNIKKRKSIQKNIALN